ncbi:MAG: hypothetical protein AAF847_05715 [Bacteroidota bacterium]
MKNTIKHISLFLLTALLSWNTQAQVAVNNTGNAPDAIAMLEVTSTERGFLAPKMTEAQRDAIGSGSPATGLLIYQTDGTDGFYYFDGMNWVPLAASSSTGNIEPRAMINGNSPSALGLLYSGPSRTDADNRDGFQFVSDEGYYIDINNKGELGQSWIWYSGTNCTGVAYAEPEFYGPGAVFVSPLDGNLFFIDQTATLTSPSTTAQSRYIVDSNTCQVISNTQEYYPLMGNNTTTTGINLSSGTTYTVTFQ